jgi:hypothetical protein
MVHEYKLSALGTEFYKHKAQNALSVVDGSTTDARQLDVPKGKISGADIAALMEDAKERKEYIGKSRPIIRALGTNIRE